MIIFLNLEYFLVAAEELNFTRAARKLYISQQSLSNHISNLEKEFDVILFNRTSPLTLTYAGRALKTRARELLDLRDETYKEISDIKDFSTGQLSIGVSHTRGRVILPEILPTYQSQFPGIELHLAEGNSSQLASDLLHGNIDLMIDLLPFTAENVETVPICNEEILMVVPDETLEKAYPGQVEEIKEKLRAASDIRLLEHCPFVLLKKGNREVLDIFGYHNAGSVDIADFTLGAASISLGENMTFSFTVSAKETTKVRLEYAMGYVKADGRQSRKIFQISEILLKANKKKTYIKKHSFSDLRTRKHYPGTHSVTLIVNGAEQDTLDFELTI